MKRSKSELLNHYINLNTPKNRIAAFCIECIVDEDFHRHWRRQVTDCSSTKCPLWPLRPQSSTRCDLAAANDADYSKELSENQV